MGQIAVDTSFLIDFQREASTENGPAFRFLSDHADDHFYLSLTVLGEYAAGFSDLGDVRYRAVREHFGLLEIEEGVALLYRTLFRDLKAKGQLIGTNDLWIAATSIHHDLPLLTRNHGDFGRVSGLRILAY